VDDIQYSKEMETKIHQTIKKVSQDFESLKFNTAIAAMMSLVNDFYAIQRITREEMRTFLILLNPVAPHMSEEMWELLGYKGRVYEQRWAVWEEEKTVESTIEIGIQINGRVRGTVLIAADEEKDSVREKVMSNNDVLLHLEGKAIVKEVYVPGRIYNIVVK
jgi:leucyl-tRNA synthetase